MRWILLLLLVLAVDLYVYQAFRQVIQPAAGWLRQGLTLAYWAVPVLLIGLVGLFILQPNLDRTGPFLQFMRALLIILYLSKLLVIPLVLIDDLRRAVQWVASNTGPASPFDASRSRFLSTAGLLLGGLPFLTLTYGMVRNPYRYKIFRSRVKLDKLPENLKGLRIVQISDIHSGSFTFKEPVKRAVEMINELKPDLVFFTGDLVNDRADEMADYVDVFDKIEARYGVYSVLGNHDYGDYAEWPDAEAKAENLQLLKDTHRRMGWQLLNNENRLLDINGQQVAVIGVENYSAHERFPRHGDLKLACNGCDAADLRLLLSHDPSHWEFEVVPEFPEVDITFSGHTHGMQFGVEIPGWVRWSPIKYMYQQWAGLYRQGEQYLYVNRGLGFIGYPGRVGILPEITCLELA